ncbi:MAG: L-methionine/branched-chain amino acid transporter [Parashewanella sp.]
MKATIGQWQGAGLMATTLLGTGVFILPQMTINVAQTSAYISWILLTLSIIPVALIFGKLSSVYPHAAGPAYFVEKAFGRTLGRTVGLIFVLVVPVGAPAAVIMTFQFVEALFSVSAGEKLLLQLLMLAGLFQFGRQGLQVSAKVQFALTLAIVAVVVLLFGSTTTTISDFSLLQPSGVDTSSILVAAGIAFWSFLGIEAMTHLVDDFKNPKKDMLSAMMIGTVLVGIIYLVCTLVLLLTPNQQTVAMVGAFDQLVGGYGAQVIGILGIVSGLATVNVYSASVARLMRSFSQERILPRYFDKVNKHNVPERALAANVIVMAVVLVLTYFSGEELERLISWSNGVFVFIYLMAMLSAFRLLSKKYHLWASLGCIFCISMAVALGENMLYAMLLIMVTLPMLWWQKNYLNKQQLVK